MQPPPKPSLSPPLSLAASRIQRTTSAMRAGPPGTTTAARICETEVQLDFASQGQDQTMAASRTGSRMLAASGHIPRGCGGAYSASFSRCNMYDSEPTLPPSFLILSTPPLPAPSHHGAHRSVRQSWPYIPQSLLFRCPLFLVFFFLPSGNLSQAVSNCVGKENSEYRGMNARAYKCVFKIGCCKFSKYRKYCASSRWACTASASCARLRAHARQNTNHPCHGLDRRREHAQLPHGPALEQALNPNPVPIPAAAARRRLGFYGLGEAVGSVRPKEAQQAVLEMTAQVTTI